ncbi:class I SAM-dependent methyltransferase [Allorhodopirellula heiligendammensis]|uniref:Methyltransferase domain protein n=1 Tax=Allorhodopirellula heiligendammensis TaxID=2714739 RepID=A0A5C6C201_9BACT|nr:class I SAM-dependent methyltransferase [Allorhodopirellula heiligendammensis]TWU18590.1 Methyltransferase domain protein [Allorhodopirellula heiligendammensis]
MNETDVCKHNQGAWDQLVNQADRWTKPVDRETVERARTGDFTIVLTPTKPVPADWFPPLNGSDTLCLASAGGQQAPILAAAGAKVTVFDNSPKQLDQDRFVADRDGLEMKFVEGDMADLSMFSDESFDFIFHPCSNTFVPKVIPVWQECHRVLRSGGVLMAGFTNAMRFIFDDERKENGNLEVRYALPYSDLDHVDEEHIRATIRAGKPLEFGHTLEDQIGGQLRAGLLLTGLYEDRFGKPDNDPLSAFLDTFIATRAVKP